MKAKAESLLALFARAAVLKEKHALEAQEEQLRKRRELLEIKVAISASTAELAVVQGTWECSSGSQTPLDGMNSYLQSSGNPSPVARGMRGHKQSLRASRTRLHRMNNQREKCIKHMEQNSTETHVPPSDRANEIAAAVCQQQLLMSLPPGETPVFNGDLPPCKTFIRASEHGLKSKTNKAECLHFLEQLSVGQHMPAGRDYQLVKEPLEINTGLTRL